MVILCLLPWPHIILTVLLVAATVATMSVEETFREASSSTPSPQMAQRNARGTVSLVRTIGVVIALLVILSAVFIAIIRILRGAGSDARAIPNQRPGRVRSTHIIPEVSLEEFEIATLRIPPLSNLPARSRSGDSVDTLPVYYPSYGPPKYTSSRPETLPDSATEVSARPLPLSTGASEEEIDLGTPQAVPHTEVAAPIHRLPEVEISPRVQERS